MAKPSKLCKLERGKLLGAFDGFVDTFNWIVDFCANLKGDRDAEGKEGGIVLDRTNDDHPIIRGGGGGGGGGGRGDLYRNFHFDGSNIGSGAIVVGRRPYEVSGTPVSAGYTGYKSLSVTLSASDDPAIGWSNHSPFSSPNNAQSYLPCYHFTNGAIDGDYRGAFFVQCYE